MSKKAEAVRQLVGDNPTRIRVLGGGIGRAMKSRPYRFTGERAVNADGCPYWLAKDEQTGGTFAVCCVTSGRFEYEKINEGETK